MLTKIPKLNVLVKRYAQLGCACTEVTVKQSIRINTLKIDSEKLLARLRKKGAVLTKIPYTDDGYFYEANFSLGATPEYLQGYYYLQESASQLPAKVLAPKEHEVILDMCAAPGSKTTQIAQMINNTGVIVALDSEPRRLLAIRNNAERLGISNILVYKKDARFAFDLGLKFDKVLLDAPCSGNYAIEEDFFNKKNIEGIRERSRLQKELLKAAVRVLKNGGTLVYSTCSLEPEENEMNVDWLLKKHPEMKLISTDLTIGDPGLSKVFDQKLSKDVELTRRFWPQKTGTEGFFIAKFVKMEK